MKKLSGLMLGIAATALATPADAAVFDVIFSGYVSDLGGNAEASGVPLGARASLSFRFDDALGTMQEYTRDRRLFGGLSYSTTNPAINTVFSTPGFSDSFSSGNAGSIRLARKEIEVDFVSGETNQSASVDGDFSGNVFPSNKFEDFSVLLPSAAVGTFASMGSTFYLRFDRAELVTSAVPEPSSWALMIVGFGVVGATVRRRKADIAVKV